MIRELERLFKQQTQAWPQLAKGLEGLAQAKTRPLRVDWYEILVRHIPHRLGSTRAAVDRESIGKRRCFLCVANQPPEEEGLPFDEDYTMYCNPFPIVDGHLTIVHRKHRAQRIAGQVGKMLALAASLPGYFVIYNGPECGASAPDHMHFQAGARGLLPIKKETAGLTGITVPNYGRNVLLFRGRERSACIDRVERAVDLLGKTTGKRPEPLVNIAVFHESGEWVTYLFPRGKHRPEAFHTGELTVSPASIDLCGMLVVPLARDFESITSEAIAAMFREVTLPDEQCWEVVKKLESTH
jgi:ATP adenylyltransferase/5',5'''-P-1,P-4-tetraphosphate phosphorylase II